jgi:hypothetical protein
MLNHRAVYKARNRLDNVDYAVKRIVLKNSHEETFVKILREVTTLAKVKFNFDNLFNSQKYLSKYFKAFSSKYRVLQDRLA